MEIKNEHEFNGESARALRESLGLTQEQFWTPVCVSVARGSAYEIGRNKVSAPVKRLLWLHYVVGIQADMTGIEERSSANQRTRDALDAAKAQIDEALNLLPASKKGK